MREVTLEEARIVASKLSTSLNVESVVLFGSVARVGRGQDLDLLIVKEEEGRTPKESYREVHEVLRQFYKDFSIDFFVVSPEQARKLLLGGNPFLRLVQKEGRNLYMKESVKVWLRHAKEDLAAAEHLYHGGYYRPSCYHAQQAVEKAMKGMLVGKGWEIERIHNIERLAALGDKYGIIFDIPEELVLFLDGVYRGRYPAEEGLLPFGEPARGEVENVISSIRELFQKWGLG